MYNLTDYIIAVEQKTGLKVKNYSNAIQDPQYFADYYHINVYGSEKFIDVLHKDAVFH